MFSKHKLLFAIFILSLLVILILFLFVRQRRMSADKFIEIYVQLSIAQQKFQDDPAGLEAERKKIFSEYEFSQKELEEFLEFYQKNPEKWVNLWEKINRRLSKLIEKGETSQSK